jgi:hypothetical protein
MLIALFKTVRSVVSRRALTWAGTGACAALCTVLTPDSQAQIRTNWFDMNPSRSDLDASNPNGSSGGRVNHLGATSDMSQVYAASEWGGLWTSLNQGLTWTKVTSFTPSAAWDVKVDPRNAQKIYATSFFDGRVIGKRTAPRSGISISTDAGNTWTNAPRSTLVSTVPTRQSEPSAWQIAINPNHPNMVFVGTNCGLARSFNGGVTWTYVDPSPADNAEQIFAVVAHGDSVVDVIGDNGHFRSTNAGTTWSAAPKVALNGGIGSLDVSPAESYVLFATVGQNIFETDDAGVSWPTSIPTPAGNRQGRIPFVKTNQRLTSSQFDLWFGDVSLFRTTANTPVPAAFGGASRVGAPSWVNAQNGAHNDVGDLLLDPRAKSDASPLLFTNDGGVYHNLTTFSPASQNPNWEQPDVTTHATWVFGFDGTQQSPGTHGIYYGLQDDGTWGTTNAKEGPPGPFPTWKNNGCCDAFDDAAQSDLIAYTDGAYNLGRVFRLFRKGANFSGGGEIPNYPSAGTLGGFNDGRQVVRFGNHAIALALSDAVYITNDINANPISWASLDAPNFPGSQVGGLKVSTVGGPTSIYYHTGSGLPTGVGEIFRRGIVAGAPWLQLPHPAGITGFTVYDVDPTNGDRILACGIDGANLFSMWMTPDYGVSWTPMPGLDNLMTGNGAFKNRVDQGPTNFTGFGTYWQPFMVQFNDKDPNTIVAGAADAGIFLTTNLGNDWALISNPNFPSAASPHIARPIKAYFTPVRFSMNSSAFDIWIGAQGSGVEKVLVESP